MPLGAENAFGLFQDALVREKEEAETMAEPRAAIKHSLHPFRARGNNEDAEPMEAKQSLMKILLPRGLVS